MSAPSVPELIRDVGQKINQRCSQCGRWSLFRIGHPVDGFLVCLMCDTTPESRKAANLKAET